MGKDAARKSTVKRFNPVTRPTPANPPAAQQPRPSSLPYMIEYGMGECSVDQPDIIMRDTHVVCEVSGIAEPCAALAANGLDGFSQPACELPGVDVASPTAIRPLEGSSNKIARDSAQTAPLGRTYTPVHYAANDIPPDSAMSVPIARSIRASISASRTLQYEMGRSPIYWPPSRSTSPLQQPSPRGHPLPLPISPILESQPLGSEFGSEFSLGLGPAYSPPASRAPAPSEWDDSPPPSPSACAEDDATSPDGLEDYLGEQQNEEDDGDYKDVRNDRGHKDPDDEEDEEDDDDELDSTYDMDDTLEVICDDGIELEIPARIFAFSRRFQRDTEIQHAGRLFVSAPSEAVEALVRFISRGVVRDAHTLTGIDALVTLLREWDFASILSHLLNGLKGLVDSGRTCPLKLFALASRIDDTELAEWLIRCHYGARWAEGDEGTVGVARLDLLAMPRWAHGAVDADYLWALGRAQGVAGQGGDRGKAFLHFLEVARPRAESPDLVEGGDGASL